MPISSAASTSGRLLALLSMLQLRRDWPGQLLADRLEVSARTVRRDVDRLRDLGYPVTAVKGPDGGYRLDAGAHLPPLLFDDEQAVALALALRGASALGAGIDEAAGRALHTLAAVMPARLKARLDALQPTVVTRTGAPGDGVQPDVLLTLAAAIRDREEVRFDQRAADGADGTSGATPPRQLQAHHLVAHPGHWYVIGWSRTRDDWRIHRVDRMVLRTPNGPRFTPREIPTGDPAAFLAARFKGSQTADRWPCMGTAVVHLAAAEVAPFVSDGTLESLDESRSRVEVGAWSWVGLAARLARFDAELGQVGPAPLRDAFAVLADRAGRAAAG